MKPKGEPDPRWAKEQISLMANIYPSDVSRALQLIGEGSPVLLEMILSADHVRIRENRRTG